MSLNSTEKCIEKLQSAFKKHNVVAVIDIPKNSSSSRTLSKSFLSEELIRRLHFPNNISFEQAVDLGVKDRGKEVFSSTLNRIISGTDCKVPQYFEILEKLGVRYFVEAHYSPLLRNELVDSNRINNYLFCSRDEDFSFEEEKSVVISLFGDTEYNKSQFVGTQNEFNRFYSNNNHISASLRSILKGTVLFIDFESNSDKFRRIYDYFCQHNGVYPNEAFLITESEESSFSYGTKENLNVIHSNASDYLQSLLNHAERSNPHQANNNFVSDSLPQIPYKYLHSFEESDHMIFFGREKEIKELALRVRGSRQISMVTALSGCGKTSIINAGLIPLLKNTGDYDVFYVRAESNPWASIVQTIFRIDCSQFNLLDIALRQISQKKYQLIIIDQFEECFINSSENLLHEVDANISSFLERFPTISILISIRQDFFAYLTRFKFLNDTQIHFAYRLNPLSIPSAIDAISKPTCFEKYNFSYEQGLIERVICDLSINDETGNRFIEPSQLQIVCFFLFQELIARNQNVITAEIYNELGQAAGILENYIDDSLNSCDERKRLLGREILKCLVSSKYTKIKKKISEIHSELCLTESSRNYCLDEIEAMLEYLVKARLLKAYAVDEENKSYELTHEYIIRKIKEWMDEDTLKFKEISELFRVEYRKWVLYRTIMPENLYKEVWKYRNKLHFISQELSFILVCFISYQNIDSTEFKYWISLNKDNSYCESDLLFGINQFSGRRRILAGVLLSVICPSDDIFHMIYDALRNSINPYLSEVETQIVSLGEQINHKFSQKMHEMLNIARTEGMCIIPRNSSVALGLSTREGDNIIKRHDIGNRMKPYFPAGVRKVSFCSFRIDKYTVTNRMYAEFDDSFHYKDDQADYPAVGINFEQACAYAHWWGKDIPTEDEWEYAARGNDFRYFPWGNDWDFESELNKNEHEKRCNTSLTGTDGARSSMEYPLGKSPFGCYNMSGNVWEWTKTVAEKSNRMIVKGGSWSQQGIMPWSWYRYSYSPDSGYQNVGFRCVLRGE